MVSDFTRFLIRLKIYRAGLGHTQQDIAKYLDISLRTYQRVEQGMAPLEVEKVHKLCKLFDISYTKLTEPQYNEEENTHLSFFDSHNELIQHLGEETRVPVEGLQKLNEVFLNNLFEGMNYPKLAKESIFTENSQNYFFSNPTFSWLNPALIKSFDPTSPVKVPVVKNVENLEEIIQVWELSQENKKKWYISKNDIKDPRGSMVSHAICHFNLHEGLPFVVGHIYKITPKN